jgi:hypothetical protein
MISFGLCKHNVNLLFSELLICRFDEDPGLWIKSSANKKINVVFPQTKTDIICHAKLQGTDQISDYQNSHSVLQLPFISMSCSSDKTSFVIGSTPFSAIYFSTSLLSNTQFDNGEIQGCSGTSLLTKQIRIQAQICSHAQDLKGMMFSIHYQGCKLLSDIGQCPTKFGKCPSKSNFDWTLVRSQKKLSHYTFFAVTKSDCKFTLFAFCNKICEAF